MQRGFSSWKAIVVALFMGVAPLCADAQGSSLNTYSPYTFYGIGDIKVQGPTFLRSMGGIGVAYSNPRRSNFYNPASYSQVNPRSVLFNVGVEGGGVYSESTSTKDSYNYGNFSEISLQLPLAKGFGMGITVNPYSSVGYRVETYDTDPEILANVGSVLYSGIGDGNISQAKLGVGAAITKKLSVGANMIYYHGQIGRDFAVLTTATNGNAAVSQLYGVYNSDYSRVAFDVGAQYYIVNENQRRMTVAAVYRPRFDMSPYNVNSIYTTNVYTDSVYYEKGRGSFNNASQLTAGFYYQTNKFEFGVDYDYQNWAAANNADVVNGVEYRSTNSIRAGMQYIPNAFDARKYMRRVAYRFGYRFSNYYLVFNGTPINDQAITFGLGFPLGRGFNNIDLGLELGTRGKVLSGSFESKDYELVKDRYIKFSIGLSLFGEDYWFAKQRYE